MYETYIQRVKRAAVIGMKKIFPGNEENFHIISDATNNRVVRYVDFKP